MQLIKFECESITPMFMYGADGSTPELRPASIKGVLRFWWRAIHGNLSLKELHEKEGEIFGSTKRKSSFTIRVVENLECGDFQYLPHKSDSTKKAFSPNQTFQVIFSGQNLELIKDLFILSTTLGGFGQRSRRGFGSVAITKINNIHFILLTKTEDIKAKLTKINQEFKYESKINYPYIQEIEVGKTYLAYQSLLEAIGQASHTYECDELGYAKKEGRLASPIYVSILKFGENDYRPIIATLKNTESSNNQTKLSKFKSDIL